MDATLGKEYKTTQERERFLRSNCDNVVPRGYIKRFTPEEVEKFKDELADVSIKINDIEEEKKVVMADFKRTLEEPCQQRKELLTNIRQKATFVTEDCYLFVDKESRLALFYNVEGDLIDSRPATADELQLQLFAGAVKTGTDE